MGKLLESIKKKNALIIVYLFVLALCAYLSRLQPNWIIIVMLIIVGIVFKFSYNLFGKVEKMGADLSAATDKIKNMQDGSEEDEKIIDNLFEEETLSKAYKNFTDESARLKALPNNTYRCNISEYINTDLVDITLKKNLLNMVPSAMTGLGILGTFIGLSIALQNFNTGTAEEISNSIAPLMEGIKVAFHTSIYGMILSLLYNFFMKKLLEETYTKIDDFLDIYEKYIDNDSENDNNSKMQMLVQEMPVQIARQLKEVLNPLFEKIEESLTLFNENARQEQEKGIEKMVNIFDEKMGSSLEHLSGIIEQTSKLQKENNESILAIVPQVTEMAANVTELNKLSAETIEKTASYIDGVDKLQSKINEDFDKVCDKLEKETEAFENIKVYTDTLNKQTQTLTDITDEVLAKATEHISKLTDVNDKHIEAVNKAADAIVSSVTEKAAEFVNNTNEQVKALADINAQYIDKLNKETDAVVVNMQTKMNELVENINASVEKTAVNNEKQIEAIGETSRKLVTEIAEKVESYIDKLASHEEELKNASTEFAEATTRQLEIITQFEESLTDHAMESVDSIHESTQKIIIEMSNTAKKQIESVHNMSAGIAESMNEATNELAGVSKELSNNLKSSMDVIFAKFDNHLAEIALSLSGTIKEIENTTERVPAIVDASYEGMERAFEELQKAFDKLVYDLKEFEKQIKDKIAEEVNAE